MTPAALSAASREHERLHAPNRNARRAWLDSIEVRDGCRGVHPPRWIAKLRTWVCGACGVELDARRRG